MPPRQPLKLSPAAKRRKPAAKPAQPEAIAPAAATKPRLPSGFSPYPDLTMAIAMLEKRKAAIPAERAELIDKWLVSLKKVQQEMSYLRKLETLSENLTTNH